jgi:hypothetical protein
MADEVELDEFQTILRGENRSKQSVILTLEYFGHWRK